MLDEVQEGIVGPVDVFEHENRGALVGERLEEPAPGSERFRPFGAVRDIGRDADQWLHPVPEPSRPAVIPSGSSQASSFDFAVAESSESRIPAWPLTISASAQKVMPSP